MSAARSRRPPRQARRATARGDEVYAIAREVVAELEHRLVKRLGAERVDELRNLLLEVNAELLQEVN